MFYICALFHDPYVPNPFQLLEVYDCTREELRIGPFSYDPIRAVDLWLQQPDEFLIQNLSSVPEVRPHYLHVVVAPVKMLMRNINCRWLLPLLSTSGDLIVGCAAQLHPEHAVCVEAHQGRPLPVGHGLPQQHAAILQEGQRHGTMDQVGNPSVWTSRTF